MSRNGFWPVLGLALVFAAVLVEAYDYYGHDDAQDEDYGPVHQGAQDESYSVNQYHYSSYDPYYQKPQSRQSSGGIGNLFKRFGSLFSPQPQPRQSSGGIGNLFKRVRSLFSPQGAQERQFGGILIFQIFIVTALAAATYGIGANTFGFTRQTDGSSSSSTSNAVDGAFSAWVSAGCSVTCGAGMEVLTRTCSNPAPSNGGADCQGSTSRLSTCNLTACARRRKRRAVQYKIVGQDEVYASMNGEDESPSVGGDEDAEQEVEGSHNLYFVETNPGQSPLALHQLCSLESAARVNKDSKINVVVPKASDMDAPIPTYLAESFKDHFATEKLDFLENVVKGFSCYDFMKGMDSKDEQYYKHLGDVAKSLLLFRRGGAVMDWNALSLKKMPRTKNFYTSTGVRLGSTVMAGAKGRGQLTTVCDNLNEESYNDGFSYALPEGIEHMASELLMEDCDPSALWEEVSTQCEGAKIFPKTFGATALNETELEQTVLPLLHNTDGVTWQNLNKLMQRPSTYMLPIYALPDPYFEEEGEAETKIEDEQPLYKLMKEHCPLVFENEVKGNEGDIWRL